MAPVGGGAGGRGVPVEDADVVEQRLVVGLDRHDVVAAAVDDLPGGVRAAVQGVGGDDAAGDADLAQQPADAEDLAAGADLPAHDAAAVLDRGDEHAVLVGAAGAVERRRLAVEGDGAAVRAPGGREAAHGAVERVGVEFGQLTYDLSHPAIPGIPGGERRRE